MQARRSECKPDGEVTADAVRQAGGHVNYAAASIRTTTPPSSFTVIISPQQDVRRAAQAVASDRVYLAPPEMISDIASRLTGAWDSIRTQARPLGQAEADPVIAKILRTRRALPSQWLPRPDRTSHSRRITAPAVTDHAETVHATAARDVPRTGPAPRPAGAIVHLLAHLSGRAERPAGSYAAASMPHRNQAAVQNSHRAAWCT